MSELDPCAISVAGGRKVLIFAYGAAVGAEILRANAWSRRTGASVAVCQLVSTRQVLTMASEHDADLVVVPAEAPQPSDTPRAENVVLGVVRTCVCPVLVNRPHARSGHIVAATDLSDPSLPAVRAAAVESRRRSARLTVVHCVEEPPLLVHCWHVLAGCTAQALQAPLELRRVREARAWSRLQRIARDGTCRLGDGAPARVILDEARARAAELIVIGAHGGPRRKLRRGVVEEVVGAAPCPVLVVRLDPAEHDELPDAA
jgi:nucleotide-binding universal stress UspA family protein